MRGAENLQMGPGSYEEEHAYATLFNPDPQRNNNYAKSQAAVNTQVRLILILLILIIFLFLALIIIMGFLLISYKNMAEELSRLRESGSNGLVCRKGWKYYDLSCYYKSTISRSWESAQQDCERKMSHLMIINGGDEMDFLRDFSENKTWWIGLRKVIGAWEWYDGTSYEVTPKFWVKGQPNNGTFKDYVGGQDCVLLKEGYGWDDRQCAMPNKYICEKEIP